MVQVEISQLSGECNTWREKLRQYRDEFSKDKIKLQRRRQPATLQRTTPGRRTSPQPVSHSTHQHSRSEACHQNA